MNVVAIAGVFSIFSSVGVIAVVGIAPFFLCPPFLSVVAVISAVVLYSIWQC